MRRSSIISVLLVLAMATGSASPAWSKSEGQGGGQSNKGDTGKGDQNKDSNSPGGQGKSKSGNAKAKAGPLDDKAALAAVKSGKALSLEKILSVIRSRLTGRIINIRLFRRAGNLVYEVKTLSATGAVANQYFQAQSGKPTTN